MTGTAYSSCALIFFVANRKVKSDPADVGRALADCESARIGGGGGGGAGLSQVGAVLAGGGAA